MCKPCFACYNCWNLFDLVFFFYAEGEVFDASQYVFFGKNAAEEVELGGLEDEDEYKAMLAVEFSEDDLFINKEEVLFSLIMFLFNLKFVATMFTKLTYLREAYTSVKTNITLRLAKTDINAWMLSAFSKKWYLK